MLSEKLPYSQLKLKTANKQITLQEKPNTYKNDDLKTIKSKFTYFKQICDKIEKNRKKFKRYRPRRNQTKSRISLKQANSIAQSFSTQAAFATKKESSMKITPFGAYVFP